MGKVGPLVGVGQVRAAEDVIEGGGGEAGLAGLVRRKDQTQTMVLSGVVKVHGQIDPTESWCHGGADLHRQGHALEATGLAIIAQPGGGGSHCV